MVLYKCVLIDSFIDDKCRRERRGKRGKRSRKKKGNGKGQMEEEAVRGRNLKGRT